ncbi:MAG: aminotransferase class V-fold PLP-dependent enzyme [Melioribacteraceae bacterium]|nr:aminotransferase class V-fold PLP-dependent enzyme [Melioribacteraceae bacterium]MCF8354075.1 aminotransferase class V-fold PLP-dependent enzyme [Melioribacteraceae bacterium]MCF8393747.1 aminotransferase class V-fold PLP-dependent enzyme [Melioribacteraceae bacterium]MCF8419491.1 aminotransferase class V-fold PLP-dependent enzyme [Melioribacteraceae bacterium]
MSSLEKYFEKFRNNIIGYNFEHEFETGKRPIIYADWAASGRLYKPIEDYISNTLGPYVANTHTETTLTGTVMTNAYHQASVIIKKHVHANSEDRLLFAGFGMTAVINKFQRMLGLRLPEQFKDKIAIENKPLVILTHMEHHSNQTSWVECMVDIEILKRTEDGLPDLMHLRDILKSNINRKLIIGSFTACSNVTGIITPYPEMAEIMHEYNRLCFIDFSASAAYVDINMHPENDKQSLDAIFFSPHKFLGGPGSSGVIVFNSQLYQNKIPDQVGGGTVLWTNPWSGHRYFDNVELREDGGTPGFLQGIKAALAILLKEEMSVSKIIEREHELKEKLLNRIQSINGVTVLEASQQDRLGYISFYIKGIHHNLIVRLLNDRFGIQTRGGCSCAGTYGHVLLHIDFHESKRITEKIDVGDLSEKPGWVRISIHPTMTNEEIDFILDALNEITINYKDWIKGYKFDPHKGDFDPLNDPAFSIDLKKSFKC